MVNKFSTKIKPEFAPYMQAVLNEMIEEYLLMLADDYECSIRELPKHMSLKALNRCLSIYTEEVQNIWLEQKKGLK
jgi:hypothetical protein